MALGPKLRCYFPSFNHNSARPEVTEPLMDPPVGGYDSNILLSFL